MCIDSWNMMRTPLDSAPSSNTSLPRQVIKSDLSSSISKFVDDIAVGKMSSCEPPLSCSAPAPKPTYLQALLGDNPPLLGPFNQVQASQVTDIPDLLDRPVETDLVSSKRAVKFSSGYMEESLALSFNSTSFTQQRRNRSVSLSALSSSLPFSSPLRTREHTSEAGSPTLEQVLLMRQRPDLTTSRDLGYGSLREPGLADDLYSCLISPSMEEEDCGLETFSPRPTLQDIVGQFTVVTSPQLICLSQVSTRPWPTLSRTSSRCSRGVWSSTLIWDSPPSLILSRWSLQPPPARPCCRRTWPVCVSD